MPVLFGCCYTILLKKQQDTRYRPRKILLKKGKLFFTFLKITAKGQGKRANHLEMYILHEALGFPVPQYNNFPN